MFGTRKLGKTSTQRKALLRQQVTDLLENGKMETTFYRAKEVQPVVEKMITLGKKGNLAAYRRAMAFVTKEDVVQKLFKEIAPKFADRNGNIDDVALGYKEPTSYIGDGAASGKSVGRVAGRIARGQMTIDGVEYRLEVNNGPNHLHGGSKAFANRYWEGRVETNRVVFSYISEDMEQGYPG